MLLCKNYDNATMDNAPNIITALCSAVIIFGVNLLFS